MIDAHEVVDHLKEAFNQTDIEIVLLLSQGTLIMKDIQRQMIKKGFANIPGFDENLILKLEEIDVYLSNVIEEECPV